MSEDLNAEVNDDLAQEEAVSEENNLDAKQEAENESEDKTEKTGNPKVDDPWPSSARNKVNRLNKQLAKERAQIEQMRKSLEQFEAAQQEQKAPKSNEPSEDDFDNYGDYLKALARYRPDAVQSGGQEKESPEKIREEAFKQAQQQFYMDKRTEAVAQQAQKALQDVPELRNMVEEYSDVLESYPPEIEMAFLQSDNAPMAFYALAREGRLEELAYMNPIQAAHEIARAQIRGEQMVQSARETKAPPPIKGAKPTATGSKSLADMNIDELLKWSSS